MLIWVSLLSLLFLKPVTLSQVLQPLPPSLQDEVNSTVPEIIAKYHYSVEVHHVITEDGYILSLHRILPSRKPINSSVLVMHGIFASSADWIITGPSHGLGYILSNEGYDVWLGNARGNRYSRNHTSLDPKSKEFWDFSFHEIGVYDLPATIDYILGKIQQEEIFYIGHSQGTAAFYVMCSLKPEYNAKIKAQFSMAPIAFVNHMFSPIMHFLAAFNVVFENVAYWMDLNELLPKNGVVNILGEKLCGAYSIGEYLCDNALFAIAGFNLDHLNLTLLPLILTHVPAGSSTKQVLHFSQEINSGHFRQYDYGYWSNFKLYGQLSPPDYDLSKITVPIYTFSSNSDWISSPEDVATLSKQLKSSKGDFFVADGSFTHIDYMYGMDAPKVLYNRILSLMTRY